ncbi:hypothetical protein [Prescottella equi]
MTTSDWPTRATTAIDQRRRDEPRRYPPIRTGRIKLLAATLHRHADAAGVFAEYAEDFPGLPVFSEEFCELIRSTPDDASADLGVLQDAGLVSVTHTNRTTRVGLT